MDRAGGEPMTRRERGGAIPDSLAARIIARVSEAQHVAKARVVGPDRSMPYFRARAMCAGLMRQCGASLPEIGKHLGGRDHTTVINMLDRLEGFIEREPDMAAMMLELRESVEKEHREHVGHMARINRITAALMAAHPSVSCDIAARLGVTWNQSEDAGEPWKGAAE